MTRSHYFRPSRAAGMLGLLAVLSPANVLFGAESSLAPRLAAQPDPVPASALTRLYVGMWTSHVRDPQRGLDANSLIGVAWRGYYGATFVNSYGDRAFAAGVQRSTTPSRRAALKTAIGYRAGFVTGYDERFLPVAASLPAVPFVQLVGSVDRGRVGAELAYAGLVASFLVSVRL